MLDTAKTLAAALNKNEDQINHLRRKGVIPFIRLGHRTIVYNRAKVLAALERFEVKEIA